MPSLDLPSVRMPTDLTEGEAVRRLMTGPAWVHYGQIYVESSDFVADLGDCFGGQQNGLCGAAIPGKLFLITGLHTGTVGFSVELHDEPPPIDDEWEEIVECSFIPASSEVALVGWGGEGWWPLELPQVDCRVRYCGVGMDAAHQVGPPMDDEPLVDRYLLQFWPAPPEPDRVVKQTSAQAAYWHDVARKQPPPPTAEERAAVELREALERERRDAELRLAEETRTWGGTLPSDRLRELSWPAIEVARLDRPLVDVIDRTDAATQRALARWAARSAFVEAKLAQLDWIASALDAMDRDKGCPETFRDPWGAYDRAMNDDRAIHTVITTLDGRIDNFSQQAMAFPAIEAVYAEDPLRAAIEAVRVAVNTFGYGRDQEFFAELRQAFPSLRS
jgi:hypothetical protein